MSSKIIHIPNKATHDEIVNKAHSDSKNSTPTIIYVSNSALPICRAFTPKYEDLAEKYSKAGGLESNVKFCQLDFSSETSAMFKFSPNQLPVIVFLCKGPWSKTMMSPNVEQLEDGIKMMLEQAQK